MKKINKSLTLRSETVRRLTGDGLINVRGGLPFTTPNPGPADTFTNCSEVCGSSYNCGGDGTGACTGGYTGVLNGCSPITTL